MPEPAWVTDEYTRVLLNSSERHHTVGQRSDGWSVERVLVDRYMSLFLSAGRIESFDDLSRTQAACYLLEIGTNPSIDGRRPSKLSLLSWQWQLQPTSVDLPVGAAGAPDERVWVLLSGARTPEPTDLQFTPRTVSPYVATRDRFLDLSS